MPGEDELQVGNLGGEMVDQTVQDLLEILQEEINATINDYGNDDHVIDALLTIKTILERLGGTA